MDRIFTGLMGNNSLFFFTFFFLFGLCLGSFINVCIWRIPRGERLIFSRSYCPKCTRKILWYDNIPLVSYIILKGRCRWCKGEISIQYPLIEFLTGMIFVGGYWRFGISIALFIFLFISTILIIISGIDFYHQIIPNIFSYGLVVTGFLSSFFNPYLTSGISQSAFGIQLNMVSHFFYGSRFLYRLLLSLVGMIVGGGFLFLIALIGKRIFKREAMGGGDIKLMAGIGTFVGPGNVIWILFLSSLLGAMIGGIMRITGRNKEWQPIPFGPFISLGTLLMLLFGNYIVEFYKRLLYISF